MKFYLTLFFVILLFSGVKGQSDKIVEAELFVIIEKNETEFEVVERAKRDAKILALEKAFGVFISESNVLRTKSEGLVKQNFVSVSNALVNGEWIKTLEEKVSFVNDSSGRWVKVFVKGIAVEIKRLKFEPQVSTANCLSTKCITTEFKSGEQFYLNFKSPKNGFVSIYCDDGTKTQRLLPYSNSETDIGYEVLGDHEYVFFSKTKGANFADEIELFTNAEIEINKIYILFSEDKLTKPNLDIDNRAADFNAILPKSTESSKFYDWFQKLRLSNKNLQVNEIDILIKK
jgi:hypothetical protein